MAHFACPKVSFYPGAPVQETLLHVAVEVLQSTRLAGLGGLKDVLDARRDVRDWSSVVDTCARLSCWVMRAFSWLIAASSAARTKTFMTPAARS